MLEPCEPKKVGRKKQFDALVSVRLSDLDYTELYTLARVADKDVSVIIREAIAARIVYERRRAPR